MSQDTGKDRETRELGDRHSGQGSMSLQHGKGFTGSTITDTSGMPSAMQRVAEAGLQVGKDLGAALRRDSSSSTKPAEPTDISSAVELLRRSQLRHQDLPNFSREQFDEVIAYLSTAGPRLEGKQELAMEALNAYQNDSYSKGWPSIRASDLAKPTYRDLEERRRKEVVNKKLCSDDDLRNIKASHIRLVLKAESEISTKCRNSLESIAKILDEGRNHHSTWRVLEVEGDEETRETMRKVIKMSDKKLCSDDDLRNIKASHIRYILRFNDDISDDLRKSLKSIAMKQDSRRDYQSEWRALEKKVEASKDEKAIEVINKIIEQMRFSKEFEGPLGKP